jgi:hypothetical protein
MASEESDGCTKKRGASTATDGDSDRAFAVVLEQMRGDFRVFGEDLQVVREQMTRGFEEVNRGLEQVDRRFDRVDEDLVRVKDAIGEQGRQLKDVHAQLRDLRAAVDRKVDRDEVEGIVERAVARAVGH